MTDEKGVSLLVAAIDSKERAREYEESAQELLRLKAKSFWLKNTQEMENEQFHPD